MTDLSDDYDASPEPPDWVLDRWEQEQAAEHITEVHGGALCDCPPEDDPWAEAPF